MKKRDKSFLTLLFFKSVLMGTVNKLPGISGGLVALITGFYIEMINSLKKLDFNVIKLLLSLNFKKINKDYNGTFLLIIFLGIVVSYFTTSQILDIFFQSYELHVSLYNSILIIFGIRSDIYHDVELIKIVLVFTLGSISGLVLLSSILSFLITNFEKTINQLIIGFVFGSLFIVWPWNYSINNFDFSYQNLFLLLWILLGFFIVLIFNRYAKTN